MRWMAFLLAGCTGVPIAAGPDLVLTVNQRGTSLLVEVPSDQLSVDMAVTLDGDVAFDSAVLVIDGVAEAEVALDPCALFGTAAALVVTVDGAELAEDLDIAGTVEADGTGVVSADPIALCGPGPYYIETAIAGTLLITTDGAGIQVLDHLADRGVASSGSQLEFEVPAGAWDVECDGASWVAFLIM